ncbi:hypothetical protein F4780DRAFT_495630 [Xylariomycetidae sp. FL0641]|nr:hypothetical protein F4780DRAFT_495630 [Xylariomycetidae sp. FL0641]
MNALQQKCRPKHQVLVLRCYPRTTKGAVDVKPNSSELSYLLFYATSRRSKIQKVGQFLEKKTASDVWRLRIGNVQVTLQILAALIEKSPKDLPLFAQNVLKILDQVLRSNDITMVEASLPTFGTFCEHHDVSSLFADQGYLRQYEDVVRAYATFASTRTTPGKGTPSKPVALRWRNAGLGAIRSIARSDALSSVAGRQLDVIVPMVLENLWTDNEDFLDVLRRRAHAVEKVKAEPTPLQRRRTSISTVKTEGTGDANPVAFSGTSGDIDKMAEEDIGVAALQCLKQVFVIPNRAQLHGATLALLEFIKERIRQNEVVVKPRDHTGAHGGWAIKMFELVTRWAPVQDRYVIMVTATDTLLRTVPSKENVGEQSVLASIIGSLLCSDINLIGLSIMDVLLGLMQHIKRVLKCSTGSSDGTQSSGSGDEKTRTVPDSAHHISSPQKELIGQLQQCMGDLATHVYYADQISDMISAVLLRLRPHPSATNATMPSEKANGQPGPANSSGNISEDQHYLDSLFALDVAKETALKAIKSILLIANPKTKISGNVSLTRNKVPTEVWEGTQWLLRDPDGRVRKAYAEAVVTWLERETTRADRQARVAVELKVPRHANRDSTAGDLTRPGRAASNPIPREKKVKAPRTQFLQSLHVAIYDSALAFMEDDTDIAILHVLLAKLVSKLGVNAARYGVPMVFRLQEDIQEAETPSGKVRLGCLCHGYFWALSEYFNFETTAVGRAVQHEIVRRRSKHFWVEGVQLPPPTLDQVGIPGVEGAHSTLSLQGIESEALLPFDDRVGLVENICAHYKESVLSPPTSPSASPGRGYSQPAFSATVNPPEALDGGEELPVKFKEDMSMEWTRESALMALQEGSKSESLSGSKTGTATTKNHRLTANGGIANGHGSNRPPSAYAAPNTLRPVSHAGGQAVAMRKSSLYSSGSGRSGSPRATVASVDQLKSVLTGEQTRPQTFHTVREDSDSSESMVSYEAAPSEVSFPAQSPEGGELGLSRSRSKSRERKASGDSGGPLTSHPMEAEEDGQVVPPVPPLPASMVGKSPEIVPERKVSQRDHASKASKRNTGSRGGDSLLASSFGDTGSAGMDLQSMLMGIDSKSRQHTIGNLTRPPY